MKLVGTMGLLAIGLFCSLASCSLWPAQASISWTVPNPAVFTSGIISIPYKMNAPTDPASCQYQLAYIPAGQTAGTGQQPWQLPYNAVQVTLTSRPMPSSGNLIVNLNDLSSVLPRGAVDGNYYLIFGVTSSQSQTQNNFVPTQTLATSFTVETGAFIEQVLDSTSNNFAGLNLTTTPTVTVNGWGYTSSTVVIGVPVTSTTFVSATELQVALAPASLTAGETVDFQVQNGSASPLPGILMPVAAGSPTITGVSPTNIAIGSVNTVRISGTNFTSATTVNVAASNGYTLTPGSGITILDVGSSGTYVDVSIDLTLGNNGSGAGNQVAAGATTVTVNNQDSTGGVTNATILSIVS